MHEHTHIVTKNKIAHTLAVQYMLYTEMYMPRQLLCYMRNTCAVHYKHILNQNTIYKRNSCLHNVNVNRTESLKLSPFHIYVYSRKTVTILNAHFAEYIR